MKIAFFGPYRSFDYFNIGGTESFTRRLATGLLNLNHQVNYVFYGAPAVEHKVAGPGIELHYVQTLKDAFNNLSNYEHVLSIALPPKDRLQYLRFRRNSRRSLQFHHIYFSWPDSVIRRKAAFLDARLYPFNGHLICVSSRQLHYVSTWSDRGLLLLPPVPEIFFKTLATKNSGEKLRVTYIGRTDPGKGIEDVIALSERIKDLPDVEMEIHGLHHAHSATLADIHHWLCRQEGLRYFSTPFEGYDTEVDANLSHILGDTDILLLPYRKLSSTIDMPLLLLEGMASLCAVVTPAFGNIPDVYGSSPFLLSGSKMIEATVQLINTSKPMIQAERHRIYHRNQELGFQQDFISHKFINAL